MYSSQLLVTVNDTAGGKEEEAHDGCHPVCFSTKIGGLGEMVLQELLLMQ